jgi:hypothetical protein
MNERKRIEEKARQAADSYTKVVTIFPKACQGTLTKWKGSIRLTSSLRQFIFVKSN